MQQQNFLEWLDEKEKFWANKMDENFGHDYPLGVWTAFWQVKQFLQGNTLETDEKKDKSKTL